MNIAELITNLEGLRIEGGSEFEYCDFVGIRNDALDKCIAEVMKFARSLSEMKDKIDSTSTLAYMNGHRIEVKKDSEWMKKDIQEIVNEYI